LMQSLTWPAELVRLSVGCDEVKHGEVGWRRGRRGHLGPASSLAPLSRSEQWEDGAQAAQLVLGDRAQAAPVWFNGSRARSLQRGSVDGKSAQAARMSTVDPPRTRRSRQILGCRLWSNLDVRPSNLDALLSNWQPCVAPVRRCSSPWPGQSPRPLPGFRRGSWRGVPAYDDGDSSTDSIRGGRLHTRKGGSPLGSGPHAPSWTCASSSASSVSNW